MSKKQQLSKLTVKSICQKASCRSSRALSPAKMPSGATLGLLQVHDGPSSFTWRTSESQ